MKTPLFSRYLNRLFVLLVCSTLTDTILAQNRTAPASEMETMLQGAQQTTFNASLAGANTPVDNVVSAAHYVVGPGDVLLVQIVGALSLEIPVTITPENSLLLPRLGEISLVGKTLAQAKAEIQKVVQSRNPLNKAYVSLHKARTVYVTITGNVLKPGLMTLPASMKISTAVLLANQQQSVNQSGFNAAPASAPVGEHLSRKRQTVIPLSARYTQVLHRDGSMEYSDQVRALALNAPGADPTLREGDQIYVPFDHEAADLSAGNLSIAGAVQRPCLLPYRKGDNLSFILRAAYGLSDRADSQNVTITESVAAGSATPQMLHVRDIMRGTADREVLPGSSVVVGERGLNTRVGSVSVIGEVRSPGVYPIEKGSSRLRALIAQAGGLSTEAHLPTSYILRLDEGYTITPTTLFTRQELLKNLQYSSLTAEDTVQYASDLQLRRPTVACDFAAALERGSEQDNISLHDGDVIVIGKNPHQVFVFGQVKKSGFVDFRQNTAIDEYIRQAGGYTDYAEAPRTKIIKSGSRLWIPAKSETGEQVRLESGDQIYVPRTPELISDLAFKKIQVELQRENNKLQLRNIELQESNRLWQIIGTIAGVIGAFASIYVGVIAASK